MIIFRDNEDIGLTSRAVRESDARLDLLDKIAVPAARLLIEHCRGQKPLGSGAEKVVYPFGEDKAVAFFCPEEAPMRFAKEGMGEIPDPLAMKRHYYEQKIAHALVPEHVPAIHMVGTMPNMHITDRVIRADPKHPATIAIVQNSIKSTEALARRMGRFDMLYEATLCNILYGKDGTAYYVDDVELGDTPQLERGIAELDEPLRSRATRWLRRWRELKAEIELASVQSLYGS